MGHRLARATISVFALGLVALHAWRPDLKIDAITLGLVIVCILPWAAYLIKSAKFPGGWEVTFRDVEAAVQKIIQVPTPKPVEKSTPAVAPRETPEQTDPNLALVNLRIEIEKRLRNLAAAHGLPSRRSLSQILSMMRTSGLINDDTAHGLQNFISWGNQAAHGAQIDPSIAWWATDNASKVLSPLDSLLSRVPEGRLKPDSKPT